uniref:beta-N-acetylhexosaminidase n=1 Tax=Macrostomum lignano TaxID=282301 RepID=A0A1I8FLQ5_9PLAT
DSFILTLGHMSRPPLSLQGAAHLHPNQTERHRRRRGVSGLRLRHAGHALRRSPAALGAGSGHSEESRCCDGHDDGILDQQAAGWLQRKPRCCPCIAQLSRTKGQRPGHRARRSRTPGSPRAGGATEIASSRQQRRNDFTRRCCCCSLFRWRRQPLATPASGPSGRCPGRCPLHPVFVEPASLPAGQDAIVRARRSILDSSLWPEPAPRLQRPPKLPSLGDSFRRQSAYGVTSMRMPEPADARAVACAAQSGSGGGAAALQRERRSLMWPSVKMNESYTIAVSGGQVNISAPEPWGAMYGLETLAQLISRYPDGSSAPERDCGSRTAGILLDTSRHYLPVRTIMQNLGAYSGRHVYSQQDVASIVEHARRRGIRVVPEFDTPRPHPVVGAGRPGLLTRLLQRQGIAPDGTYGP